MSKQEFLDALRNALHGLPQKDIEERLTFYSEMIDDRIEEGVSEEEAVLAVGLVDEIATQAIAETPLAKIAKERIMPKRRLSTPEIVLLALGSPVWLCLILAALTVIFSVYVVLWSVIISLWSVFTAFAACALGGVLGCAASVLGGNILAGIAVLAGGLVFAGLSVFMFFGCKAATKGTLQLTRKIAVWSKKCFVKGEEVK